MDFLIWFWLIYIIGSLILSIFVRMKALQQKKKDYDYQKKEDDQKLFNANKAVKHQNQRHEVIQKNKQRTQQLRENHRDRLSHKEKLKEAGIQDLKQSLSKITKTKDQTLTEEHFTASQSELTSIASEGFSNSEEYFEGFMEEVEDHLDNLDDWYSDQRIEDVSWMGLEDKDILVESKSIESKGQGSPIQHLLSDGKALRDAIIFHEVMNKPKSLRRNNR